MRKMTAILGLIFISSSVFASEVSYVGNYSAPSSIRFFGYTQEDCDAESGSFEDSEGACYLSAENTISIETNQQQQNIVNISVLFGPANMRDFSGVVTQIKKNVLTVKEADIEDNGTVSNLVKGGCRLTIKIIKNKATLSLGKSCDRDLGRASDAVKK